MVKHGSVVHYLLSASDSTFADGGVAFGGTGWVDLLSVGYDNNADHDLDP